MKIRRWNFKFTLLILFVWMNIFQCSLNSTVELKILWIVLKHSYQNLSFWISLRLKLQSLNKNKWDRTCNLDKTHVSRDLHDKVSLSISLYMHWLLHMLCPLRGILHYIFGVTEDEYCREGQVNYYLNNRRHCFMRHIYIVLYITHFLQPILYCYIRDR